MATYNGSRSGFNITPRLNEKNETPVVSVFVPAVALAAGDTITMLNVPPGVVITDMTLDVSGVDTGSGLRLEVGDASVGSYTGAAGRFITGAQPNALTRLGVPGSVGYAYPAQSMPEQGYPLVITCTAAATTFAAGGRIALRVSYSADAL